jgi:hypothetical protein
VLNRTNKNAVAVLGVEHYMRLKPKAPASSLEVIGGLSDTGKARK